MAFFQNLLNQLKYLKIELLYFASYLLSAGPFKILKWFKNYRSTTPQSTAFQFKFSGWSYHRPTCSRPAFIALVYKNKIILKSSLSQIRTDVRQALGKQCPKKTGFEFTLSANIFNQLGDIEIYACFVHSKALLLKDSNQYFLSRRTHSSPFFSDPKTGTSYEITNEICGFVDKCKPIGFLSLENAKKLFLGNNLSKYFPIFIDCLKNHFGAKNIEEINHLIDYYNKIKQVNSNLPMVSLSNIVTAESDVKNDNVRIRNLRPKSTYYFSLPFIYPNRLQTIKKTVKTPAEQIFQLNNACILFGSIVLTGSQEFFVHDPSAHPNHDFVSGNWNYVYGSEKIKDKCLVFGEVNEIETIEKAILLNGRSAENYFHWLIEYLPRLKSIFECPDLKDLPLIVSESIAPSMKESLALIAPQSHIIWTHTKKKLMIRELYIPSMHTYHPDSLDIPFSEGSALSYEHLQFIRDKILSYLPPPSAPNRKIFLKRTAQLGRTILNSKEIEFVAIQAGFEIIDPSQLSFLSQVQLFSEAKLIAGPGGAAFSNLIFCQPHCKIIALVAQQNQNYSMQSNLGHFAQCEFITITGRSKMHRRAASDRYSYMHAPFSINPQRFKHALNFIQLKKSKTYCCST